MSKIFNSTQKQWNNKNKQWLEKPLQKKARPNSAQTIGVADTHSPSHNQEGRNGDLKIQIRSLNEKSDDNRKDSSPQSNKIDNPNKSNKHAYVPEVDSNKLMQMGYNDDTSAISRQLEPVYKNNGKFYK